MTAVRGSDTAPEIIVRKLIHGLGFRFRLHRADLPGKPDVVLPRLKTVVFVHGCFWHRHGCAAGRSTPASNREYWTTKFERNVRRDRRVRRRLVALGWRVLVIWECQTKPARRERLVQRLQRWLLNRENELAS